MVCLSIRRSLPNTCENDFNRPVLLLWPKGSLIIGVENEGASRIDGNRIDDALVVLARNDAGLTTLSIDKTNDSARRSSRTGRSCGAGLACLSLRPVGCTGGIGAAAQSDTDARERGQRDNAACFHDRSEERRVGKECRSRWSPYH